MRLVETAKVTVAEAQDTGNLIGRRCMKLSAKAEVPDLARVLAKRLTRRWVKEVMRRRHQEEEEMGRRNKVNNTIGYGGCNAGA